MKIDKNILFSTIDQYGQVKNYVVPNKVELVLKFATLRKMHGPQLKVLRGSIKTSDLEIWTIGRKAV